MRIVLDLQGAQTESRFRGIGRYSSELALAVAKNAGTHDVWIALNGGFAEGLAEVRSGFEAVVSPTRVVTFDVPDGTSWNRPSHRWRRSVAELMREAFLRDLSPDAVHVSSLFEGTTDRAVTSAGLLPATHKTGVTLYDLIPLHNPAEYLGAGWAHDWYSSKVDSLRRSDVLFAISAHARQEAIDALGISPERVINISSAVSSAFRKRELTPEDRMMLKNVYSLDGPYVMYSGAMDKRKNVEALVEAFASLPSDIAGGHRLVIAGKVHELDLRRLRDAASRYGLAERLVFTGYVSDHDLILLYNAADLYVFPSLHEGFGLPALEAMACGVATIGSSTTSVPEVIGRADAMFDPTSVADIANRMASALGDRDFHRSLREHALTHSAKFSWDRSAKALIEGFETAASLSCMDRSWGAVSEAIRHGYAELISEVAAVHRVESDADEGDRIAVAAAISSNVDEALHAARTSEPLGEHFTWRVEGPFDSSYSLALVNREVALALSANGLTVALHSTEGPGDFAADPAFLQARPDVAALHAHADALPSSSADVSSRLLYPPRVSDMKSRFNLLHDYAWEESGFPAAWVDNFNESLQGISALSHHVQKLLVDNGVAVPMAVASAGVDHWDRVEADTGYLLNAKSFRFLHVSSCFPRKGADILLKAFGDAFGADDDVTLIIKTFANPHNEVHRWLDEARQGRPDFPDVQIIEENLTDSRLKALYGQCHCLVAPSRAEGFGLPLAEAMISGLPVITTAWGGQLDFCSSETAWLVDYDFAEARTHFGIFQSVWAEPRRESLAQTLIEVYSADPESREERVIRAQRRLRSEFRWGDVARRMSGFVRRLSNSPRPRPPRIGWVSTWNKRCGIASYSGHLVEHMPASTLTVFATVSNELTSPDSGNVVRCWNSDTEDTLMLLSGAVAKDRPDVVVIQFQYGFFEFRSLSRFILEQKRAGRTVVVMLHATQDPVHVPTRKLSMLVQAFRECDRLLVHNVSDLNRLKVLGLVDNVAIIPHGIPTFEGMEPAARSGRFRIASYGFCLPHKGLPQLIDAVAELVRDNKDVELVMLNAEYPVGESADLAQKLAALIAEHGLSDRIRLDTRYLADDESFRELRSADLIVFPYQGTGESSSAAVRYGLAVGRPVAVTPISIFDDVGAAVHRLPGVSSDDIARGIAAIMGGGDEARQVAETSIRWREAHRYTALGRRLYNMLFSLHAQPDYDPTVDLAYHSQSGAHISTRKF